MVVRESIHIHADQGKASMYTPSQSVTTLFAEVSHGYKHLSLAERHYLQIGRKMGKSLSQIASELSRSSGTVSLEVKRNTGLRG